MADAAGVTKRFLGVENSPPPTERQSASVAKIRAAVNELAHIIDQEVIEPRYRATALTDLESASMFAVKGIFQ